MSSPPVQVIRASDSANAKGEPTLIVGATSNYNWLYNDQGSGSHMDVSIYRPNPSDSSFFILGDYAQGNYSGPTGNSTIVKAINDDPENPLLKLPISYAQVWNDHGSGGRYDGSIWFAVPPDGYRSLGFLCNAGYDPPSLQNYACLRRDLTVDAQVGSLIWNDKGSGAPGDVSLYQVIGVSGIFVAQANYNPYTGPCYKLAS